MKYRTAYGRLPVWPPPESRPLVWRARARLPDVSLSQDDNPPDIELNGVTYFVRSDDRDENHGRYAGYVVSPNPVWVGVDGSDDPDPDVAFRVAVKKAYARGVSAIQMMGVLKAALVEEVTDE